MDKLAHEISTLGRIDLAREPDFALGVLEVRPARREVSGAGARHVLQRRVMQVLVALVRSPNEVVSQNELIGRCWDGLSVSDDAIGRCIGQLRRLAATWAQPPFAIETIPGVGYRINPRTPGTRPEVQTGADRPPFPWRRAGLAAALLAVVGAAAAWWFGLRPADGSRAVPYPTVVVTPFQPADSSPAAKTYAATLTGEVSGSASGYNLVVVRPGPDTARPNSGSTLGADFLVEGRVVQKGGGRTVTSDLVDARHGVVVYSFDTPAPSDPKIDVAAVIAGRVARSLDPTKLTTDLAGKLTPSDYTLVARANDAIDRWDMVDALGDSRALAASHPDDGDLQASVGITEIFDAQASPQGDRPALIRLARDSMARAEKLRPDSALLHVARGMLVAGPLSWAAQEREFRRALALDPNLHVTFNSLGEVMLSVGRTNEGVALISRSIELDPMSEIVITAGAKDFIGAGATDGASDALKREETLFPDHSETARYLRYWIALYMGAPRDAASVVAESPEPIHSSVPAAQRAAMLAALTSRDVRPMVAQCFANFGLSDNQVGDQECLLEMAGQGDLDDAFRFAERAYPDNRNIYPLGADGWLIKPPLGLDPAWLFGPKMKPFRDDPRFWDVALRAGLVDYWRATGAWPDDCEHQLSVCKGRAAAAIARDRAGARQL